VCVIDDAGKVVLEQRVPTEPADIIAVLTSLGVSFGRIGIEAGPLSQWLVNGLIAADLPVICVETRHMKALLTAQQISKTDRNDARGIAQMMRVGLFKPVHVKTLVAQEQRMLLGQRNSCPQSQHARNRKFADSLLEGAGFELPVREHRARGPPPTSARRSNWRTGYCGAPGRFSTTSSMRPNSFASAGDRNLSRSTAAWIASSGWPVCLT